MKKNVGSFLQQAAEVVGALIFRREKAHEHEMLREQKAMDLIWVREIMCNLKWSPHLQFPYQVEEHINVKLFLY